MKGKIGKEFNFMRRIVFTVNLSVIYEVLKFFLIFVSNIVDILNNFISILSFYRWNIIWQK